MKLVEIVLSIALFGATLLALLAVFDVLFGLRLHGARSLNRAAIIERTRAAFQKLGKRRIARRRARATRRDSGRSA
jgi:type II secretory pathway component PulJ